MSTVAAASGPRWRGDERGAPSSGRSSGVSPGSTTTVAVVVDVVVGEGGEADDHGVAGAPLDVLLDEVDEQVGEALVLDSVLVTRSAPWPTTTTARSTASSARASRTWSEHRPAAQQVQRLGPAASASACPRRRRGRRPRGGDRSWDGCTTSGGPATASCGRPHVRRRARGEESNLRLADPKSAVLPLDDPRRPASTVAADGGRGRLACTVAPPLACPASWDR